MIKKIVYVIDDITIVGGREKITLSKASELVKLGYEIHVISYRMDNEVRLPKNITFHSLNVPIQNNSNYISSKISLLKTKYRVTTLIQEKIIEIKPDIIVSVRDLFCNTLHTIKTDAKKIVEIHGCYDFFYDFGNVGKVRRFVKSLTTRLYWKNISKVDRVVILSSIDCGKWRFDNIKVIPNFIQSSDTQANGHSSSFISAGRLAEEKGFDILIDVWDCIKSKGYSLKLDIFGEGEQHQYLNELISKRSLEKNIVIKEFVPDIINIYSNYYACIVPSRYEAFPMVALESIHSGVPVIAFDIECGMRDIVINNKTGITSNPYDIEEMADSIIKIHNDLVLRDRLSKSAKVHSANFTVENVMDQWVKLFDDL